MKHGGLILLALAAAGCGQKGPLVLPGEARERSIPIDSLPELPEPPDTGDDDGAGEDPAS